MKSKVWRYLLGAVAYLSAVVPAYWNLWQRNSPTHQKAVSEAMSAGYLYSHLPKTWNIWEMTLDLPEEKILQVFPVKSGSDLKTVEQRINVLVALTGAIAVAHQTNDISIWRHIGELRVKDSETTAVSVIPFYATQEGPVGFRKDGICYVETGQDSSEALASLIENPPSE